MKKSVSALLVVAALYAVQQLAPGLLTSPPQSGGGGEQLLQESFEQRRSDVLVQADGVVTRILPDDNDGSRHQRFLLSVGDGQTVLVAHNIDLAPRVDDLERGDRVEFFGEYEWNSRGGVIHWTHHDPGGRHPDGWLRHKGVLYQ